jgi:hypothetical protein
MGHEPITGRPPKERNPRAGDKLRRGLELLGKSYGKNVEAENHVLRWVRWTESGLPKSTVTIGEDMRRGVPADRLAGYAKCLGLPVALFADPNISVDHPEFVRLVGEAKESLVQLSLPVRFGFSREFHLKLLEYNRPDYIAQLYGLLRGVYRISYKTTDLDHIGKCVFFIHARQDNILKAKGLFVFHGLDMPVFCTIYRWHNNIHFIYHSGDMLELGQWITIDPLRHQLVSRRLPFVLRGRGVTDNGLAYNTPISFSCVMEKFPENMDGDEEAVWAEQCVVLRKRPHIVPSDSEYIKLLARINEPDIEA